MPRRLALVLAALASAGCAGEPDLVLGTTTSTLDSGLLDALLPAFEAASGLRTRAVVGGTGEIHEKARAGDVGALLSHSPERERRLVAEGVMGSRMPVMFNRFVLAGPAGDPSRVAEAADARDAMRRLAEGSAVFVSRGDGSGTHERELALWARAGVDPASLGRERYKETGSGQAHTLLFAAERDAYLLVDEATLRQLHANGRARGLVELLHDDDAMRNQYAVVLPPEPTAAARAFAAWITGAEGQAAIGGYAIGGARVFAPNAGEERA